MSEQGLKKEFNDPAELQRIRNLIQKKFGDNTKIVKGYELHKEDYKEGDVWTENNKEWTIRNGIKVSTSSTDEVRKDVIIPLWCPKCGSVIKNNTNKKFFKIYQHCFNCQIKIETKMKIEGTYKEFEEKTIKENVTSIVTEVEEAIKDYLKEDSELLILTPEGYSENWEGSEDKQSVISDVQKLTNEFKEKFEIETPA